MSAMLTPSDDLIARHKAAAGLGAPFTTFATGHFVRPAASAQPVAKPFAFGLCDVYVAAPFDLDFDEPNAVCEANVDLTVVGT